MTKIGVIGGGAWGTALAVACVRAENEVILWARNQNIVDEINERHLNSEYLDGTILPTELKASSDFPTEQDILLIVTPAQTIRETLKRITSENTPIVLCSKGIEQDSLFLMSEVAAEILPNNPIAVLSGPNFADEVAKGLPSATSIACSNKEIGQKLIKSIGSNTFRTYLNNDVIGTEISGAVKNVIAIACGITIGKGLGENAKAALVTRGIAEIAKLSHIKGGKPETLMGLCGMGDMMLSCSSLKSRNMSLGYELSQGKSLKDIIEQRKTITEGLTTTKSLYDLINKLGIEMPICNAVYDILYKNKPIDQAIEELLHRPVGKELIV